MEYFEKQCSCRPLAKTPTRKLLSGHEIVFTDAKFGLELNKLKNAPGENCLQLLRSLLFISDLLQM